MNLPTFKNHKNSKVTIPVLPTQKDLYMPVDSVSHLPDIQQININPIFPNRTDLYHLHNMAHSRGFFFSYILQSRFKRPAGKRTLVYLLIFSVGVCISVSYLFNDSYFYK